MNVFHQRFSLAASVKVSRELLMQTCWWPLSDHWSVQPTSPHLSGFVFYGCLESLTELSALCLFQYLKQQYSAVISSGPMWMSEYPIKQGLLNLFLEKATYMNIDIWLAYTNLPYGKKVSEFYPDKLHYASKNKKKISTHVLTMTHICISESR